MQSKRPTTEESTDRAVSPVIGVILMVAITVILAAVIAAFVLDIGPGDADPQATYDLSDTDDGVEVTLNSLDGTADGIVVLDGTDGEPEADPLTISGDSQEYDVTSSDHVLIAYSADEEPPTDEDIGDNVDNYVILENLEEFEQ